MRLSSESDRILGRCYTSAGGQRPWPDTGRSGDRNLRYSSALRVTSGHTGDIYPVENTRPKWFGPRPTYARCQARSSLSNASRPSASHLQSDRFRCLPKAPFARSDVTGRLEPPSRISASLGISVSNKDPWISSGQAAPVQKSAGEALVSTSPAVTLHTESILSRSLRRSSAARIRIS